MVKKKFEGQKLDIKGVLEAPAKAKGPAPSAWAKGAAAVAAAPKPRPPAPAAPAPAKAAQGAPAKAPAAQPPAFAPPQRPKPPAQDLSSQGPAPLPSDEGPPKAKSLAVGPSGGPAFPSVSTWQEALTALTRAAGAPPARTSEAAAVPVPALRAALGWLLDTGLQQEGSSELQGRLVTAGALVVEGLAGQESHAAEVQQLLESYFAEQQHKGNSARLTEVNGLVDARLYGELARHLGAGSPKFGAIRLRLIRRLQKATTSAVVQAALADALLPLLEADPSSIEEISKQFLDGLQAAQEPVRRASALAIAVAAKAAGGAMALKKLGVMDFVKEAVSSEGKTASNKRQGGCLCVDALAVRLGRAFEPHAVAVMPLLLASCSDAAKEVRTAGQEAARTIAGQVSSNGVKMMLNPLIDGLQDKRWRTQLSAMELLQPMVAQLVSTAPKRLAAVLPRLVPALCDAAAGARSEIRAAARAVLEQVGAAVDHPDVSKLSPSLVSALVDPSDVTLKKALDGLSSVAATAALSGPACALICPVLERGLARGDAAVRQKAAGLARALVCAVAASGADEATAAETATEIAPYLATLRPRLEALLSDQTPAVREAAAQAVGALAAEGGRTQSTQGAQGVQGAASVEGLLERLNSAGNAGDELEMEGAALGLAAAFASTSEEQRQELLAQLLRSEGSTAQRLGRLAALAQVAKVASKLAAGGDDVLLATLPALQAALTGADEKLRSAARRGFSAVIEATKSTPVAAAVSAGLAAVMRCVDVACRVLAAELALEFLPRCTGAGAEGPRASLVTTAVMAQADDTADVRRAADKVFRAAAESGSSPGALLLQLKPRLLRRILEDLTSGEDTAARMAGRAAASLQQRMEGNGGLLGDLLPGLCAQLPSQEEGGARSLCVGLTELIRKGHRILQDAALGHFLQNCLFSGDTDLRRAAAACATSSPPDEFMQTLLRDLEQTANGPAPEQIMGLEAMLYADGKAGIALKAVLAHAASSAAASAGGNASARIACLPAIVAAPADTLRGFMAEAVDACIDVASAAGVGKSKVREAASGAASSMAAGLESSCCAAAIQAASTRVVAEGSGPSCLAAALVLHELLDSSQALPADPLSVFEALLPGALPVREADQATASACGRALSCLVKKCGAASLLEECLPRLVDALGKAPQTALPMESFEAVAGLTQSGILGVPAHRKASVDAVASLFRRGNAAQVQGQAMKSAGPLVRALVDKQGDLALQAGILDVLNILLEQAGQQLRPLSPALQTGLLKMLEGPAELHKATAQALGSLAAIATRPDALIKALGKPPQRVSHLDALGAVLDGLSSSSSPEVRQEARQALEAASKSGDEAVRSAAARVLNSCFA